MYTVSCKYVYVDESIVDLESDDGGGDDGGGSCDDGGGDEAAFQTRQLLFPAPASRLALAFRPIPTIPLRPLQIEGKSRE